MFEELNKLIKNCYSPYSGFCVASIAIDKKGGKHYGVNVENSTLGATICAERNAIFSAISSGIKFGEIKEIHILAVNNNYENMDEFVTPCGICRQVIFEASNSEATVYSYKSNGKMLIKTIKELLPDAFVFTKHKK